MERAQQGGYYEIRVLGVLGPEWRDWFDGLNLTSCGDGTTLLAGHVRDQAALHGHLARVRDLALPLLLVWRRPPSPA
jgi:hypothetical protein